MVGSRWMNISDAEEFYKEKGILETNDTLKIYARELIKDKTSNFNDEFDDELPF